MPLWVKALQNSWVEMLFFTFSLHPIIQIQMGKEKEQSRVSRMHWVRVFFETQVSRFLFSYRTTPHIPSPVSPAVLLMERQLCSPLQMLKPDIQLKVKLKQLWAEEDSGRGSPSCAFSLGESVDEEFWQWSQVGGRVDTESVGPSQHGDQTWWSCLWCIGLLARSESTTLAEKTLLDAFHIESGPEVKGLTVSESSIRDLQGRHAHLPNFTTSAWTDFEWGWMCAILSVDIHEYFSCMVYENNMAVIQNSSLMLIQHNPCFLFG